MTGGEGGNEGGSPTGGAPTSRPGNGSGGNGIERASAAPGGVLDATPNGVREQPNGQVEGDPTQAAQPDRTQAGRELADEAERAAKDPVGTGIDPSDAGLNVLREPDPSEIITADGDGTPVAAEVDSLEADGADEEAAHQEDEALTDQALVASAIDGAGSNGNGDRKDSLLPSDDEGEGSGGEQDGEQKPPEQAPSQVPTVPPTATPAGSRDVTAASSESAPSAPGAATSDQRPTQDGQPPAGGENLPPISGNETLPNRMAPPSPEGGQSTTPTSPDVPVSRIDQTRSQAQQIEKQYAQAHNNENLSAAWEAMTPQQREEAVVKEPYLKPYAQLQKEIGDREFLEKFATDHGAPPKPWGEMTVEERKAYCGNEDDYKRYRDAQADDTLADTLAEINRRGETDQNRQKNEDDRVNAMAEAILAKDDTYQEALGREKQNSNDPQAQLDIGQKNLDARYDAMAQRAQQGIGPDGKPLTSQKEIDDVLRQIEAERVKKSTQMRANATPGYKTYQSIVERGNDALAAHGVRSVEERDAYGRKGWDNPSVREAFGNNKQAFKEYVDARARMKDMEGRAEIDAVEDRNKKNVGVDGKFLTGTPEQIAEQKQNRIKAAHDSWEPGPWAGRILFNRFSNFLDNWFGSRARVEERKQAAGAVHRLFARYGWKAIFPLGLDEEQRKDLRELWREAVGKSLRYFSKQPPHFVLFYGMLFLAFWLGAPFAMMKTVEIAQPFKGNG